MLQTVPVAKSHPKSTFFCENELLTNYIRKQANQDIKRKLSACFVHLNPEETAIKGYYTLSNNSIPLQMVPEDFKKKLPSSYSSIPTTLLGRLARDSRFIGKGLGELLLIDSLKRAYVASQSVASFAVVVDPIDENAERFYTKYGFIRLPDSGRMFMAMATVEKLF